MATSESEKKECYNGNEVEKAQKEVNKEDISQLCKDHCSGVSPTDGLKYRKPTGEVACCDDGSGDKCSEVKHEDNHFKFKGMD